MNRRMFGLDRVVLFLLGLALAVAGAWLVVWVLDRLPDGWWSPDRLVLGLRPDLADAEWWPWALIALGLLLLGLGVAWFLRHFRRATVSRLSLPGDAEGGRLLLAGDALAQGVADALTDAHPDVVSSSGRIITERRSLVLDLVADVRPDADLHAVAHACDTVAARTLHSTGREDLTCRVRLKVAPRPRPAARVH